MENTALSLFPLSVAQYFHFPTTDDVLMIKEKALNNKIVEVPIVSCAWI